MILTLVAFVSFVLGWILCALMSAASDEGTEGALLVEIRRRIDAEESAAALARELERERAMHSATRAINLANSVFRGRSA